MTATYPEFNYTQRATEGNKYQDVKNLSTTEIAKLIRNDLKVLGAPFKFSIRTEYFAWGSSIDIDILKAPFVCYTPEYKEAQASKDRDKYNIYRDQYKHYGDPEKAKSPQYTLKGEKLKTEIEKIGNKYNFSDCDGMIDYFHVNYYLNVGYHYSKFIDIE